MIEMINCPHGLGPLHLLCDLWWAFACMVPGVPWLINKFGYKIKSFCCGHKEVTSGENGHHHCDCKDEHK